MSICSPSITLAEATKIGQYAIDNLPVCADVLGLNIHSKIVKTLGLTRDSIVLNIGAGAYNPQYPDSLIQALPPTNLIVCDLNLDRLNSWKIFWCDTFGYDNGSVTPICTDATSLPFGDSSVDLVYSANLINDPNFTRKSGAIECFLNEGHRTLKSGGKIFLNSFGYLIGDILSGRYCLNCDLHEIVTQQKLLNLMQKAGFVDIKYQRPSREIIHEMLEENSQVKRMEKDGCTSVKLRYSGGIIASKS